jgi:putative endonuclease
MAKSYYIYILSNFTNTTLYIGVTSNLEQRMYQHKNKLLKGFTEKFNVKKLVYFKETNEVYEALKREKLLKKWHRAWKVELIRKENPYFEDLSKDWF